MLLSCQNSSSFNLSKNNEFSPPVALAFMKAVEDKCVELDKIPEGISFLKDQQVVVRMIGGSCKTFSGKDGFKKGSPWLVMGVPCSNDQAGIEWKGSYYKPDKVQFAIRNSCRFNSMSSKEIEALVRDTYKLPKEFPFLAYVPLDTQYWQLANYPDQDIGVNVELLTDPSRLNGWKKFRQGNKLDIVLFGTENAWMKKKSFYRIDASLEPSNDRVKFSIKVLDARPATDSEISNLKENCKKIIPSRPCDKLSIF